MEEGLRDFAAEDCQYLLLVLLVVKEMSWDIAGNKMLLLFLSSVQPYQMLMLTPNCSLLAG